MQCSNEPLICIEHEFEKDESSTWTPPPQKQKQQQQKKKKKKKKKKHYESRLFSLTCVRFLSVFVLLFNLFRIALWPSVRKELSRWLVTCAVFILVPS